MKATLDEIEQLTDSIKTFWFKPAKPMRYIAGQFTQIHLAHKAVDDRGDKRWFTLSSSPTDSRVSITTRFSKPSSSFKATLAQLKPGTEVNLAEPMGDFVLPKDPSIPLVFVAGGMGITPFHSMIKYLSGRGEKRNIKLLFAVSKPSDLIFKDLFQSYLGGNFKTHIGSLKTAQILELVSNSSNTRLYLSGPEPMVEVLDKELLEKGVPRENLQTDYFPGYIRI